MPTSSFEGVKTMNYKPDKGQRIFQAVTNHFEGSISLTFFHNQIINDPLEYVKDIVQATHADLLFLKKQNKPIWEETIRDISLAARILEIMTEEETPVRYQGEKWREHD